MYVVYVEMKSYEKAYLVIYLSLVYYYFLSPELCLMFVIALSFSELFAIFVDMGVDVARQMQAWIELDKRTKAG